MTKPIIAAFDFDGTLTTKDTLFDFIRFYKGSFRLYSGLLLLSPILILYKLKIISNNKAKQILFSYFFKGQSIQSFDEKCKKYATKINQIIRTETITKLHEHQKQNHTVIIISASIRNWIEPWAKEQGIKIILATEIGITNGIINGYFSTNNCYGEEKVNRLQRLYPNKENYILYAYGDSAGDKELLTLADYATLVSK